MKRYDIYISAPLFNEMEIRFNETVSKFLEDRGFTTYLPQRDGGEDEMLLKDPELWPETSKRVFERDVSALKDSSALLMVMDGRVPDEGACVELGMAYAYGKICIGFQTDTRTFATGQNNLMLDHSLSHGIVRNWNDLDVLLGKIKNDIKRNF
ncbi:MAG: nucleoside 2-deoxyribosyltransferase [Ferroplasma sp.]|uniref:nucleoside 2-deoxyribosyltransferase n=1 Tax=Ferroplasma sp. TaxID=2591003 RepID=UPI0028155E70|nr:nucleoside 2-deoxyribosyltransferase [Ferroplasma sp.]WMT50419.1 MAG: nucleoside 2-deoxyribosyltransferase [Ferroplasma sp.]